MTHRRSAVVLAVLVLVLTACSSDGDDAPSAGGDPTGEAAGDTRPAVRFCDAYLDYLTDRSDEQLEVVVEAAGSTPVAADVEAFADIIDSEEPTGRVVSATEDLDDVARSRCQSEWTAGTQGAGNTAGAAEAMAAALRAGDRIGARNIASANAIAVFAPWTPLDDPASIQVVDVSEGAFALVLGDDALAECQVETGVVVACAVAR